MEKDKDKLSKVLRQNLLRRKQQGKDKQGATNEPNK